MNNNTLSPLHLLPNKYFPFILSLPVNSSTKAQLESLSQVDKAMHQKMLQVIGDLLRQQHITLYDIPMLRSPEGFITFCGTELAKKNVTCLPALHHLVSCRDHRFSEQDGDQHKSFREAILKVISSDIESLPNLTEIELALKHCAMVSSLKNRTNLTSLKIECGASDTTKRIAEFTQLKKLSINFLYRGGRSTQNEFLSLGQCTNLQHLELSSYTHAIDTSEINTHDDPGVFCRLTRLETLLINNCSDIDKRDSIAFPTSLKYLRLHSCTTIDDRTMRKIMPLAELTYLDLSLCSNITNIGIQCLMRLTNLTTLKILACDRISIKGAGRLICLKNLTNSTDDLLRQTTIPSYVVHLEAI